MNTTVSMFRFGTIDLKKRILLLYKEPIKIIKSDSK